MARSLQIKAMFRRVFDRWANFYWEDGVDGRSKQSSICHAARVRRRMRAGGTCCEGSGQRRAVRGGDFSDLARRSPLTVIFYRAKAISCLLVGADGLSLDEVGYRRGLDAIRIAHFDLREYETADGAGGSCQEVHVGYGVFKNWYAFLEEESWP